jgi:hypothetical protein
MQGVEIAKIVAGGWQVAEKSACPPVEISNWCQLSSKKPVSLVKADY